MSRWLAPQDPTAKAALAKPSLVLTFTSKPDEDAPPQQAILTLAPQRGTGYYCGSIDGNLYPFLIDPGTYDRIAMDPLERE